MNRKRSFKRKLGVIFFIIYCLVSIQALAVRAADQIADSHFHNANYAMQGVPLKTIIHKYMGDKIARSVAFPLPLQQKWDRFEHYARDLIPPNYYLGPKAGLYKRVAFDDHYLPRSRRPVELSPEHRLLD